MRNLLVASLLASIALFVWGFVFWPLTESHVTGHAVDEDALRAALQEQLPATGTYFLPSPQDGIDIWHRRHVEGPITVIRHRAEGVEPITPSFFLRGWLFLFVAVLPMAWLMRRLARHLDSFGERVRLCMVIGLAMALFGELRGAVWSLEPWGHHLLGGGFVLGAWTILGVVLGWLVDGSD
ncbi:MAG: hypothetical protein AAGE94_17715 [Acidobacteriota bacterium]